MALHQKGKLSEASTFYKRVLAHWPKHAEALNLLGVLELQSGRPSAAIPLIRKVIKLAPRNANAYQSLGEALRADGSPAKAVAALRKSLKLDPSNVDSLTILGRALAESSDHNGARKAFEQVTKLRPQHAAGWYHLGLLHMRLGETDAEIEAYRKAIAADRAFTPAHKNLSVALRKNWQLKAAVASAEAAIIANPNSSESYQAIMDAATLQGDIRLAIEAGLRGLEKFPGDHPLMAKFAFIQNYDENSVDSACMKSHFEWGNLVATPQQKKNRSFSNERSADRPLRVGYVSPDFRQHSVAYFFESLLDHHDPAAVTTYCYANVVSPDSTTARLRESTDHWRDIYRKKDKLVAQLVENDEIDILVDLAGHTGGHRLGVFFLKPAPIQISYMGYCNTTGLHEMDFRLTDSWADPAGEEAFNTETLVRLERCFLAYKPPTDIPPVTKSSAMENGYVTFGCFNHLAKMTPEVVSVWSNILKATEGSKLTLKNGALDDLETADQVAARFAGCGIPRDRLELLGHDKTRNSHLEAYDQVDIALDPFPYNGTTTTCEALWMGVPVIALTGKRHRARVGLSLLTAAGLEQFITTSTDDYIARATALAANLDNLVSLRARQREILAASDLADVKRHARCVEEAYRSMWHQWCAARQN